MSLLLSLSLRGLKFGDSMKIIGMVRGGHFVKRQGPFPALLKFSLNPPTDLKETTLQFTHLTYTSIVFVLQKSTKKISNKG